MTPVRHRSKSYSGPLARQVAQWAAKQLAPYFRRHPTNPHSKFKQVHDPIRGVVKLDTWEVYVLDSPLLQRLRYIRQLGVGHYLFPSTGYTRFEHSLGALDTASALFESITDSRNEPQAPHSPNVFAAQKRIVRLAALVHDVGHCAFSHVSEKSYEAFPEVLKARKAHRVFYGKTVSASEVLSILIVESSAFRSLLQRSGLNFSDGYDLDAAISTIASCIAGSKLRTSPNCYLAEIINGPIDCDKLDYLGRDAHAAGVPISLDIDRILSKLRVVRVVDYESPESDQDEAEPVDEMPAAEPGEQREAVATAAWERYSLGIVPSVARAVEELFVSRIFLFDKFYFHPKVMAAEELVRRALFRLAVAVPKLGSPVELLEFGDDALLALTPAQIAERYAVPESNTDVEAACRLLARARVRDLPLRAFAFAERFLPELPEPYARLQSPGRKEVARFGIRAYYQITKFLDAANSRALFAESIAKLARELGAKSEVFVAVQSAKRATGKLKLPVVLPDGSVLQEPPFLFEASTWTEAYGANKATSYVFAYENVPGELTKVHLAAERAFVERDELSFAPNCYYMAKVAAPEIVRERAHLTKASWHRHRLAPDYLSTPEAKARVERQRDRFITHLKGFHKDWGPLLLETWLWQWRDPDLQSSALRLLEHITYVEPDEVRSAFSRIKSNDTTLGNAKWVPLRPIAGAPKSADQLNVDLRALGLDVVPSLGTVDSDEIRAAGRVVFFDDSLNSGTQATCLIGSWFDDLRRCKSPDDVDKKVPHQTVIDALRDVPVSFVFMSAHPTGVETLSKACQRFGLQLDRIHFDFDSSESRYGISGFVADSARSRRRFIAALQAQGAHLLSSKSSPGVGQRLGLLDMVEYNSRFCTATLYLRQRQSGSGCYPRRH